MASLPPYELPESSPFMRVVHLYAHNITKFYDFFRNAIPSCTVCHGDLRSDNVLLSRDPSTGRIRECVPIDMQCLKAVPGEFDLAYLLSQSLSIEDRRRHEVDLIRAYHAGFPVNYPKAVSLYHLQLFFVY